MSKMIAINLSASPTEIKEMIEDIPTGARREFDQALEEMINKAKIAQAINIAYAIKEGVSPKQSTSVPEGATIQ